MRRIGLRLPDSLWRSVAWYGKAAGLVAADGSVDISECVRDLVSRGLVSDHGRESGYRSGYREGRLAAYREFMQSVTMSQAGGRRP
ncbi:MAG: hypothetical protein KF773_24715 [Deltaproteobacteria bacterium]|nr:hypothetical protein [Deltaproteobacteria bacterium]